MVKIFNEDIKIDLNRLIETRMLITANSGAGKSYSIRKLLEETHGKIQQVVLDVEGEFGTLREKYDYILAGKGGDIPADPKTAEMLARKLLELNASAIIDLYELKHHDRIRFVKLFLDSMINAPKELWHPVLVVVDEAHIFAPEKDKSEAMGSVIDLATRGRKRGFCAVLATQRLSKLHKDASAECNNKLIGRMSQDIDQRRASDELGFTSKDQTRSLRNLEPGEFYAFGPAISREVEKLRIGQVKTTHPKSGQRIGEIKTVPTDKIKSILSKLSDIPQEAEKEFHDKESMKKRIRELESEVRKKPTPQINPEALKQAEEKGHRRGSQEASSSLMKTIKIMESHISKLNNQISQVGKVIGMKVEMPKIEASKTESRTKPLTEFPHTTRPPFSKEEEHPMLNVDFNEGDAKLNKCEKSILNFLAQRDDKSFSKAQIAGMTKYSLRSSGFVNAMSHLNVLGLIKKSGDEVSVSDRARAIEMLGNDYNESEDYGLDSWVNKLNKCERALFMIIKDSPYDIFSKEQLAEQSGYSLESSGFVNAMSKLCVLKLAERIEGGLRLNRELTEV